MPIAKITGQGLIAISVSVGLLWSSLIAQKILARRAVLERVHVIRQNERLLERRQPAVPASSPSLTSPRRSLPVAG